MDTLDSTTDDTAEHTWAPSALRTAAWGLWLGATTGGLFTAFAYLTTQDHGIRSGSPWQNDPYTGVVSFTEFLVPAMTVLTLIRASLWRRGQRQPAFRIDQLMRAGIVNATLVTITTLTDWLAAAARADHSSWNATTPWLIASLIPLTALGLTSAAVQAIALRRLRPEVGGRAGGDWLDDLGELAQRIGWRHPERATRLIREHPTATAVLLSLIAGMSVEIMQAVGEGWDNPLLFGTGVLVGMGGFLPFCLLGNAALRVAVPRTRKVAASTFRRAGAAAVIIGALALPISAVTHDQIWHALGHHGAVRSVDAYSEIVAVGGLAVGTLAFSVAYGGARLSRRPQRS